MMRVAIIGGGSYSWTPAFLRDLFTTPALRGSTAVLHDIDAGRMALVAALGRKMLDDFGLDYRLSCADRLDEALAGADAVILTITTGGLEAMAADLEIPARYGIHQTVGDTTGPGGLARALRNIPVVDAIGERVMTICPGALFLNYTNPLSTLTHALSLRGVCVVGLCHEWHGVREKLARVFGVEPEAITGRVAGINHLIWLTDLWAGGRHVWGEMPAVVERILAGDLDPDSGDGSVFADHCQVKARLFQIYGALPAAGDRHVAEFFSGFLTADSGWGDTYRLRLTSVADRRALEAEARALIEAAVRGDVPLQPYMAEQSGEAAAEILAAVAGGRSYAGIMNLPNQGQIAGLPAEAIVETEGVIDAGGPRPLAFGRFNPAIEAVLRRHIDNQELTVRAALANDRAAALQVLLNDPLSSRLSVVQAGAMLDELRVANARLARPYPAST